jgi:hypothetical protein
VIRNTDKTNEQGKSWKDAKAITRGNHQRQSPEAITKDEDKSDRRKSSVELVTDQGNNLKEKHLTRLLHSWGSSRITSERVSRSGVVVPAQGFLLFLMNFLTEIADWQGLRVLIKSIHEL